MNYLKWIAPLTILYVALTANTEPLSWLIGALLAIGITWLIRPEPTPIEWRKLPLAILGSVRFTLYLMWELLLSSVQVAKVVLTPEMPIQQGIFALHAGSQSEAVTVLSAEAITLTPGELVVEIDEDGVMYTHSLDIEASKASAAKNQSVRVQQLEQIFS